VGVVLGSLENIDAIVDVLGRWVLEGLFRYWTLCLEIKVISHVIETFQRNPNGEASRNGICCRNTGKAWLSDSHGFPFYGATFILYLTEGLNGAEHRKWLSIWKP